MSSSDSGEPTSFYSQAEELAGQKIEEKVWEETMAERAKNPPFVPNELTRGEQVALAQSQPEKVAEKPEDNEHFTSERRIFQVARYTLATDASRAKIRSIDMVHTAYGQAENVTKDTLSAPATIGNIDGPSVIEVATKNGSAFYKTISAEESVGADFIFGRDLGSLPGPDIKNVYVELVSQKDLEAGGQFATLPRVKAGHLKISA